MRVFYVLRSNVMRIWKKVKTPVIKTSAGTCLNVLTCISLCSKKKIIFKRLKALWMDINLRRKCNKAVVSANILLKTIIMLVLPKIYIWQLTGNPVSKTHLHKVRLATCHFKLCLLSQLLSNSDSAIHIKSSQKFSFLEPQTNMLIC